MLAWGLKAKSVERRAALLDYVGVLFERPAFQRVAAQSEAMERELKA